jgi:hypothetical protein
MFRYQRGRHCHISKPTSRLYLSRTAGRSDLLEDGCWLGAPEVDAIVAGLDCCRDSWCRWTGGILAWYCDRSICGSIVLVASIGGRSALPLPTVGAAGVTTEACTVSAHLQMFVVRYEIAYQRQLRRLCVSLWDMELRVPRQHLDLLGRRHYQIVSIV